MNKWEYLALCLKHDMVIYKRWVLSCFAVTKGDTYEEGYPKKLFLTRQEGDDKRYFHDPMNEENLIPIEGSSIQARLFDFKERIKLAAGMLPNVKEPVETTVGNVIFNAAVLCFAFGDKIPFMTGEINGEKLEAKLAMMFLKGELNAEEIRRYMKSITAMAGYSQLCAPSASPQTMTVNPAILKRRDELYKQHAHELNDPAVLAGIDAELVKMDAEAFKGDPAEKFFVSSKTRSTRRKKAKISYGQEAGFAELGGEKPFIPQSLAEGLKFDQMPAIADAARSASYSRGKETALGGESVKYFYRIFQNTKIAVDDCGIKVGLTWNVTEGNYKRFLGQYLISNGVPVRIDETVAKASIGKTIEVRSPVLCKTIAPSFCAKCAGDTLSLNPTGVHVAISDVGSTFMLASMKAMHGKSLSTAKYNFNSAIT